MKQGRGKSIELFFVDGDPDGMVTATIPFQWTGHVLVARRTQIREALRRDETARPGVYILVGDNNGKRTVYVGESDVIRNRIASHVQSKDWWETAIIITSSGEPLNKAHARFIESELFQLTKNVGKAAVEHGASPPGSVLSEAAKAHMADFLGNVVLVLPALGFDFLLSDARDSNDFVQDNDDQGVSRFVMEVVKESIIAYARLERGDFIVEKGSLARGSWVGGSSFNSSYGRLYAQLVEAGILIPHSSGLRQYAKDYAFKSTSAAAAVTAGRPTSGPAAWTEMTTKMKYGDWEEAQLEQTLGRHSDASDPYL